MGNVIRLEDWRQQQAEQEKSPEQERQGVKKVCVDDGFTAIPNELLFAIGQFGFTQRQFNVLIAVIQKTLSWRKEMDWISNSQLCELVDLPDEQKASKTKQELVRMKVLRQEGNKIGINLVVSEWKKDDCTKSANIARIMQKKLHESCKDDCTKSANTKETITKEKRNNNPLPPAGKKQKFVAEEFDLPEWVNRDDWIGFCDMRKSIKKPLSERACAIALGKLEKFKSQGENVSDVLKQSTFHNWQGLFAVHRSESEQTGLPNNFDHYAVIESYNEILGDRLVPMDLDDPDAEKQIKQLLPHLKNQSEDGFRAYFQVFAENARDYYFDPERKFGFSFLMKPETLSKTRRGEI